MIAKTEQQKIREIQKKIIRSNLKFEILKKGSLFLNQEKSKVFNFLLENEKKYSIRLMSESLGIDRRAYQRWKKQPFNKTQKRKLKIQKEIINLFYRFNTIYGSDRITVELNSLGYIISSRTVRKYMSELGLSGKFRNNMIS